MKLLRKITLALLIVLTVVGLGGVIGGQLFLSDIEDRFGIGLDFVMVFSLLSIAALFVFWSLWMLIFSGWKWSRRLLGVVALNALPVAFFALFRPVTDGDVTFSRFEPIWAERPEQPSAEADVAEDTSVDLNSATAWDFPRFLGPQGTGQVVAPNAVTAQSLANAEVLWKQPIGGGWAGFVCRNGFAVTMEQRQQEECVTCYDAETGELQWMRTWTARHCDTMNLGHIGPRSTPLIHEGNVYACGAVGTFVCLDGSNGEIIWQADLNEILGISLEKKGETAEDTIEFEANTTLAWGRSGSPIVVDDVVIIPGGGPTDGEKHTLLAFDRVSGELKWKGGTDMIAYTTPTRAVLAGRDQLILTAESRTIAVDTFTGEFLWAVDRPGESNGAANTSQVLVVDADTVVTAKGYPDGGGMLIRVEENDGSLTPTVVWSEPKILKTKLTSPVLLDGHSYSLSNGFLECARLSDGKRIWKHRGRFGHGQPLLVNDQLLLHSESGTLYLIEPTPEEYRELARRETIEGICWNTVCYADGLLLVRSDLEAMCLRLHDVPTSAGQQEIGPEAAE